MNIIKNLQSLGFSEKESKVYFTLLKIGPSTAYKIAKQSGLKRPTVYIILEELRKKDAILKIPYAKKQIFSAKQPDEILDKISSKIRDFVVILPQIKALSAGEKKPKIMFYEGMSEIKQLLEYKLEKNSEVVGFYAYNNNIPKRLINVINKHNKKLELNNIKIRGIAPKHKSLEVYRKKDKKYNRKIKIIPFNKYNSQISIDLTDNFVRIIDFQNLQGVIIDNKLVANSVKQIFEIVWESIKSN